MGRLEVDRASRSWLGLPAGEALWHTDGTFPLPASVQCPSLRLRSRSRPRGAAARAGRRVRREVLHRDELEPDRALARRQAPVGRQPGWRQRHGDQHGEQQGHRADQGRRRARGRRGRPEQQLRVRRQRRRRHRDGDPDQQRQPESLQGGRREEHRQQRQVPHGRRAVEHRHLARTAAASTSRTRARTRSRSSTRRGKSKRGKPTSPQADRLRGAARQQVQPGRRPPLPAARPGREQQQQAALRHELLLLPAQGRPAGQRPGPRGRRLPPERQQHVVERSSSYKPAQRITIAPAGHRLPGRQGAVDPPGRTATASPTRPPPGRTSCRAS